MKKFLADWTKIDKKALYQDLIFVNPKPKSQRINDSHNLSTK